MACTIIRVRIEPAEENGKLQLSSQKMAEAVVSFAIERIGDLLIEEAKFLHGVEEQVTELQTELIRMQCFLEDADAIRDKNKRLRNWIAEITELAYRCEIVLDTFLLKVESMRRRGGFPGFVRRFGCFFNELITLHKVGSEIESITKKLNNFSTRFQIYGIRDLRTRGEASSSISRYEKLLMKRQTYSDVIENVFVDLPDVTNGLVLDLVRQKKQYRAISICGIGGLGKTTLAKNVYHRKDVRDHFDAFAWACVSQQPKRNEIWRSIWTGLIKPEPGKNPPAEEGDLINQLLEIQATKKCLVVLDDIWSTSDWDVIKAAFPERDEIGSIVLLTTRSKDLVKHIDPLGLLKEPPLMSADQSWDLFRKKAFPGAGDTESKKKMELGMTMLGHCGGLPLAIVVLGGLLARKQTIDEWMIVNKNIDSYLRGDKGFARETKEVTEMLALSYYDLPYWLKPCFLYLANYPEDYEILTHTLYQLWIAEGFISLDERRGKEETLMDVAERYLGELAQRSMVQVQLDKFEDEGYFDRSFGRFKSCRLHDLMREMCLSMVEEENFLKVIDHGQSSERQSCSSFKIHRLAIHGNEKIDPSNPCIDQEKNIRGVLFFDGNKCTRRFREEFVSHLPKNFKLVRVMHLEEFALDEEPERLELPKAVGDLIHLRYFRLGGRCGMFELPSSIGNLRYLQTLDLFTCDSELIIPNVLWMLKQLMHLYFPPPWSSIKCDKLRLDGLDNLEVLNGWLASRFFNFEDFKNLINLRSLTGVFIQTNQRDLEAFVNYLMSITRKQLLRHASLTIDGIDFCSEDELALLKQLFFECHPLHHLTISGRIRELPEYRESFHSSLTRLHLENAELEEDPMAILEKLPNLTELALENNAYSGKEMVCSVEGFPSLEKLRLWSLDHLEDWRVDEEVMPNLSSLSIGRCSELKMVPNGLRCITTLQELTIMCMTQAFVNRLKSPDGVDFDKVSRIPSIRVEYTGPEYSDDDEEYQVADNNEEQQEIAEGSVE